MDVLVSSALDRLIEFITISQSWKNLDAQLRVAETSEKLFIITIISTIISFFVALIGICTLRASTATIRSNEKISKAQTRAYVYVEGIDYGPNGGAILRLRNEGQTPATQIELVRSAAKIGERKNLTAKPIDFGNYKSGKTAEKVWSVVGCGDTTPGLIMKSSDTINNFRNGPQRVDDRLSVCGEIGYRSVHNEYFITQFFFLARPGEDAFYLPALDIASFQRTGR